VYVPVVADKNTVYSAAEQQRLFQSNKLLPAFVEILEAVEMFCHFHFFKPADVNCLARI
jgi:hypothetical protein